MTTINSSIAAQVEILHRDVAAHLPPEALAAFAAEQADLRAAGTPVGVLGPGTSIPDGALLRPRFTAYQTAAAVLTS